MPREYPGTVEADGSYNGNETKVEFEGYTIDLRYT